MLFLLSTPEYNKIQSNISKVRVHLRNGVAEIYEQHQDLIGKVENNLVEIENIFENRIEKCFFILQDAVFIVSTQGLDPTNESKETSIYIYAKNAKEINSSIKIEDISKEYEAKKSAFEKELQNLENTQDNSKNTAINSKLLILKNDMDFSQKALKFIKDFNFT